MRKNGDDFQNGERVSIRTSKDKICIFLLYLVKEYAIVVVDIIGHSFVLVHIDGEIYIVDSYAKLRKAEIRKFDFEGFRDLVSAKSLVSYNKTFNTDFKDQKKADKVSSEEIFFTVCEW